MITVRERLEERLVNKGLYLKEAKDVIEWTKIRFSSADQPYVLTAPSPAQRRHTVNGRTFGWVGKVARFITAKAERTARAAYRVLCAEVKRRFKAAKKAARELEIALPLTASPGVAAIGDRAL